MDKPRPRVYNKARNQRSTAEAQMRVYKRYQLNEIDVVYETNGIYYICEKGRMHVAMDMMNQFFIRL